MFPREDDLASPSKLTLANTKAPVKSNQMTGITVFSQVKNEALSGERFLDRLFK